MAFTQQQAQQYFNTLTPEQQAGVPQNNLIEWFTNAVNAGVPAAVSAAGGVALGQGGTEKGWEAEDGTVLDPTGQNSAPPSEWMGKRKPTAGELRRASFEGAYGGSEDGYNRFSDRQLMAWINNSWDETKGGFYTSTGQQVGKPPDRAGDGSWVAGEENYGGHGPGGGGGGGGVKGGPGQAGQGANAALDNPLQAQLFNLVQNRGGIFGQNAPTNATSLAGGGVMSWDRGQTTPQNAPQRPQGGSGGAQGGLGVGPAVAGSFNAAQGSPNGPTGAGTPGGGLGVGPAALNALKAGEAAWNPKTLQNVLQNAGGMWSPSAPGAPSPKNLPGALQGAGGMWGKLGAPTNTGINPSAGTPSSALNDALYKKFPMQPVSGVNAAGAGSPWWAK